MVLTFAFFLRIQALRVGTITAAQEGKTMFVINGVGDKLYWAYSLTDDATDGRAQVRSQTLEEAKERLRQEFKGWDLALHILEVQHLTVSFILYSHVSYMVSSGPENLLGEWLFVFTINNRVSCAYPASVWILSSHDFRSEFEDKFSDRISKTDEEWSWIYSGDRSCSNSGAESIGSSCAHKMDEWSSCCPWRYNQLNWMTWSRDVYRIAVGVFQA